MKTLRITTAGLQMLCTLAVVFASPAIGAEISPEKRIDTGGYIITVDNAAAASFNGDIPFIPASTIKLATSLAALKILGPSYRFTTAFYLDQDDILYMKGSGDPFLTSEYLADIAEELKQHGVHKIHSLVFDLSAFHLTGYADGNKNSANPYDAPNSPVAVNFNSVALIKNADGTVSSGEPQTPYLPLMNDIAANLAPGTYRLNVSSFPDKQKQPNTLRYAAELLTYFFNKSGVITSGSYQSGPVPADAEPLYFYQNAKTVRELVKDCLKYSNNFIANQLFLACGASYYGPPATWEKSQKALAAVLADSYGLRLGRTPIIEGSGLSRQTRVTPSFMISLLRSFAPYADLMPLQNDIPLKTGTLDGVYCYAGYFGQAPDLDPFVLMLNQPRNNRQELLYLMRKKYLHIKESMTETPHAK